MTSSILKFAANVPARVALSCPTGKEIEGQYGPRCMFSLCLAPNGEKTMYLPPIAATEIVKLGIVKGQPFEVCKTEAQDGARKRIEWKVSKLTPETPKPNGQLHAMKNGIPYLDPKTEWLRCADDAIEALVTIRDHAAARGLPVQFTGDDLRQVTAVLYIGKSQDRRYTNGSAR